MTYVAQILEDGETVTHDAKVHWMVYFLSMFFLGLGLFMAIAGVEDLIVAGGAGSIFAALVFFVAAFIRRRTTELAVTDRRVIVKTGFIKRDTSELNLDRVEGVAVSQSIMGRLLGYGTVSVQGTGGGIAPVKLVDNPIAFRRAIGTRDA